MTKSVHFDEFPSGKRIGNEFEEEEGFGKETMKSEFRIVRVQGHVRWKDHGSGESCAELILKRGFLKPHKKVLGELILAEYARGSSPNEVTTVKFDLKPDGQNSVWQTGGTGKLESNLHDQKQYLEGVANY